MVDGKAVVKEGDVVESQRGIKDWEGKSRVREDTDLNVVKKGNRKDIGNITRRGDTYDLRNARRAAVTGEPVGGLRETLFLCSEKIKRAGWLDFQTKALLW